MASFSIFVGGLVLGAYLESKVGLVARVKAFVTKVIKGVTPSE